MYNSHQVAYRQLSARQRQHLRKQALAHAPSSLFGLSKHEGNLQEFSRYLTIDVLDKDKHGALVRLSGPSAQHTIQAYFLSARLGPGGPYFQFLHHAGMTAPLFLDCFGLGYTEGRNVWAFAIEDAAVTDERFAKFLRLVKASCRDCHLLQGDIVSRVYQLNDTFFVEYVDLIQHPGRVVLSSLDSFLEDTNGTT